MILFITKVANNALLVPKRELIFTTFSESNTLHIYILSIDGCILRERADGVILRKVGHKDIPDFKIGDRVIPKPVSDDEWMHYPTIIPFGIRGIITDKEGAVAYVDNGDLFTDLPNDAAATIWVEFEDLHRAIPLSPYHLEKPIEYDLI